MLSQNSQDRSKRAWYLLQCLCFWLLSFSLVSVAQASIAPINTINPDSDSQRIQMHYQFDESNTLTIEQILATENENAWAELPEEYANFGYKPFGIWYQFSIENTQAESSDMMIELSYPLIDYLDLYRLSDGDVVEHVRTGDRLPYVQRPVDHPKFLFPVQLRPGERQTFYLRAQTSGAHVVPAKLWHVVPLFVELGKEDTLHAAYFGVVIVIVIFNLLIYIALRERMYLYYSLSTLSFMLFFAIIRAKLFPVIFPNTPEFHHGILVLLPPFCLIFGALFTRQFLSLPQYNKALDYLTQLIAGVGVVCFVAACVLDTQSSLKLSVLCSIPGSFLLLLIGAVTALMGNRMGWVYTIAWGTFMFGATVAAMSKHGFLPVNFGTEYGMQIGSALEVFILNAALAYRVYREHEDKLIAQDAQLKENAERREVESQLLKSSMSHPVTLMPNRACFEQQIREAILNRGNRRVAIVIVEIKRYDEISKTLGHQNMDLMICDIAQHYNLLASRIPGIIQIEGPAFNAYLCSLENSSFGLLVDADKAEKSLKEVRNILRALIKPIEFKEMRLELNTVAGAAVCPDHGLNASTLMRHAQVTVDSADALENRIAYYRPEHDQYNTRRLTMISELKDSIKDSEMELFLQPKYNPIADKVVGVEALVRWHHKRYGTIRPDEFIPMAEKMGIIRQLTRWVFSEALQQQRALQEEGYDLAMSINLSAVNLREDDLIPFLKEELKAQRADPEKIYLELTETSMMEHPREAIAKLEQIRELGMKVSVDDFGAGYSSLAYLKTLPANEIKIDRALIEEMAKDQENNTVIRSTIAMCHELGFTVVAEGVESMAMLNKLIDLRCDLVQGYLLTPPLPQSQFIDWMENLTVNRFVS